MRNWIRFGVLALVMASGSAYGQAGSGEGQIKPSIHYHKLEPSFIVNVHDGGMIRFLQVSVNVVSKSDTILQEIDFHKAPLRHELLMMLSEVEVADITNRDRREAVRERALGVVRDTIAKYSDNISRAQVADVLPEVLFTDFVIQ